MSGPLLLRELGIDIQAALALAPQKTLEIDCAPTEPAFPDEANPQSLDEYQDRFRGGFRGEGGPTCLGGTNDHTSSTGRYSGKV